MSLPVSYQLSSHLSPLPVAAATKLRSARLKHCWAQELSAAQRKRLKKKAKAKGGKAEPADEEPAEEASKKGGKKAPAGKGVSAAVRKMQEQVEARRAAEEAAREAEEERIRKVCGQQAGRHV